MILRGDNGQLSGIVSDAYPGPRLIDLSSFLPREAGGRGSPRGMTGFFFQREGAARAKFFALILEEP